MQQRRFGLNAEGLDKLHALSVELLEFLKENMPYRTGGAEAEGWKLPGILRKRTVFFTRCVTFCCLVGLRTSVIRALSMAILITARNWPIAQTTRRYISRYSGHIPARVTCSTYGPWRQIWPMQRKTTVMVVRKRWLHLLLTGRVRLALVSLESDTRLCSLYPLGN
jgi:hypothetical protein